MAGHGRSKVADKAGSTNADKANPPPPQKASVTDKKTSKNKDEKIQEEGNPEAAADGANVTEKDGSEDRSRVHYPYALSFRKAMRGWMSVNFPGDAGPKTEPTQRSEPTLALYIGWLDSLKNRDEASAANTSTKRYWKKFCEQTQNKKMVASWMVFARDVRTTDGLLKFRPAFGHIGPGASPHGRAASLHPLISFPSAGEFKEKKNAALGRQVDADGSKEDEAAIEPLTAAADTGEPTAPKQKTRQGTVRSKLGGFSGNEGDDSLSERNTPAVGNKKIAGGNRKTATAATKRQWQETQDEDGNDSSDAPMLLAKKRRDEKKPRPSSSRSRPTSVQPK